ncbi:MAG: hypothetical protein RBU37_13770 [Myxococcota bacterium]|nr:hypothetical protein [Myxococcota bacterium]
MLHYQAYGFAFDSETPLVLNKREPGDAAEVVELRVRPGLREWLEKNLDRTPYVVFDYGPFVARCVPQSGLIEAEQRGLEGLSMGLLLERVVIPIYALLSSPAVLGMHAGGVSLDNNGWLFLGSSGAGKSTTTLGLLQRGARLLNDDKALVEVPSGLILPGPPTLHLHASREALPQALQHGVVVPGKVWFELPPSMVIDAPTPLRGLVTLQRDESCAKPLVERLRGTDAAAALLEHCIHFDQASTDWAAQRFRNAMTLLRSVPLYRLRYARSADGSPSHLPALLALLEGGHS